MQAPCVYMKMQTKIELKDEKMSILNKFVKAQWVFLWRALIGAIFLLFVVVIIWFGCLVRSLLFCIFLACAFTCVFAQDQQKKLGRPKRKLTEALQMLFSARTFQITESQWEVRCRTINEKKKHLHIQTHTQTIAKL